MKRLIIVCCLIFSSIFINAQEKKNDEIFIHFLNDFNGNKISLEINDVKVFPEIIVRKTSVPNINAFFSTHFIIKQNIVRKITRGKLEAEYTFDIENFDKELFQLSVCVDDFKKNFEVNIDKGKHFILSYDEGNIDLNQSDVFLN